MMLFKNVNLPEGGTRDISCKGEDSVIDGSHLYALPALIDPHVHFRTPGFEYKEDWKTGAIAAVSSGVTTVFDMPNTFPPTTTIDALKKKKALVEAQLKAVDLPLRYGFYFGADSKTLDQILLAKNEPEVIGVKVFMGCSTGGLVIDTDEDLEKTFALCQEAGLVLAVHAEDESVLQEMKKKYATQKDPSFHSKMRPPLAAIRATEKALLLAEKYRTRLYILHMSTKEEVALVRQAKKRGLPVFAEATTHHLFFTSEDYKKYGTLIQMNPPIREKKDRNALWEALQDGTIDTLGTDHAPHTYSEKKSPFGEAPSGIPGIETLLPLMLHAVHEKKITLERLISLTRTNIETLFALPPNDDLVLVDLHKERTVEDGFLKSKCGWTPYKGKKLKGWPVCTILRGRAYPRNA